MDANAVLSALANLDKIKSAAGFTTQRAKNRSPFAFLRTDLLIGYALGSGIMRDKKSRRSTRMLRDTRDLLPVGSKDAARQHRNFMRFPEFPFSHKNNSK